MTMDWSIIEHVLVISLLLLTFKHYNFVYWARLFIEFFVLSWFQPLPSLDVEVPDLDGDAERKVSTISGEKGKVLCFDPSTHNFLGSVPDMSPSEVKQACQNAKQAQVHSNLRQSSYSQRRRLLRTIQKYILQNSENICKVASLDSGKHLLDAMLGEVLTTCEKIRCINLYGEQWLQRSYRPVTPMLLYKTAYVEYVPFGVLGVIAPWNYPFHNLMNHIISGLFSGNAVVVKVSEYTSYSAGYFIEIVKSALRENGFDEDLVQLVTGTGAAGAALVDCEFVDKVIFTGSPGVGRKVMEGCSKNVKPIILELGGKDPLVLCEDVKIDDVLPGVMRGSYQNCGQNCCGIERMFVYESIYDEFLDRITAKVKALRQGPPLSGEELDCGAMVTSDQLKIIQDLVDDALAKGAKIHCGGSPNKELEGGNFYQPTILSGVTREMRICQEEVFGPVMCVIKVPGDSDERCIEMVNDCRFGLGASVYSSNTKRGIAIGKRIKSGMVNVNDFSINYMIQTLPFGGVGESGFDRFAGKEGLQGCCYLRTVVEDKFPFLKTHIPAQLDYPIRQVQALGFGEALAHLFYDESWLIGKVIKGIGGFIRHG